MMNPAEAGIQAARADQFARDEMARLNGEIGQEPMAEYDDGCAIITTRTEAFVFIRQRAEKVAICQDTEYAHLITFGGHTFKVWGDQLIEFAQMLNHDRA